MRTRPKGWRFAKLGEVTTVVNGTTPDSGTPEYWNGDIVWITPTDLGKLAERHIRSSDRRISKAGFNSCNVTLVPPGTVVLSSRAPIGHLGIAAVPLCTNQGCKSFVPGPEVDSEFLYYALKRSVWDLQHLGSGATFTEVSKSQVAKFEVPMPPLDEQKRIAAILSEQMAAVERARQAVASRQEAASCLFDAFVQSALNSRDAKAWPRAALLELCTGPGQYGTSQKSNGNGRGLSVLGMYHIHEGRIRWENVQHVDLAECEAAKYLLEPGDLLFNRTNSAELVGKTAVYDLTERAVFASYLIRFRLDRQKADPYFVSAYINSRQGRAFIERNMARAIGQVNISASTMHKMPVPAPKLATQKRIGRILRERQRQLDKLDIGLQAEAEAIEAMPAAILRRAFAGEL